MAANQGYTKNILSHHNFLSKLEADIADKKQLELVILGLMDEYDFDLEQLKEGLTKMGMHLKFSRVRYKDVAHFVGLDHLRLFEDVKAFELYRSRIPTSLFKSIAEDMDIVMMRYKPTIWSNTKAMSQIIAPIRNRLVAEFGSALTNAPRVITEVTAKRGINYHFNLQALGANMILWLEITLMDPTPEERVEIMAQIIAECIICTWSNRQRGYALPTYVILCDTGRFEFFKFDGSTHPSTLLQGRFADGTSKYDLSIDPTTNMSTDTFLLGLRALCETIFDILLNAYTSSLPVHREYERSTPWIREEKRTRHLESWDEAIRFADETTEKAWDAHQMRLNGATEDANATVIEAFSALALSVRAAVRNKAPPLINGWNQTEIEKA